MTTALLLHCNGADGFTTFPDTSQFPGKVVTAFGDAQVDTAQSVFGGASAQFDGTGDYLQSDAYSALAPGGSWTVECWIRIDSLAANRGIFHIGNIASGTSRMSLWITSAGALSFYIDSGGTWWGPFVSLDGVIPVNSFRHVAVVKQGTNIHLYANGARRNTFDSGWASNAVAQNVVHVGRTRDNAGNIIGMSGWIDEFRYTPDVALYTGTSYTVPSAQFTDPVTVDYGTPRFYLGLDVLNADAGTPRFYLGLDVLPANTGMPRFYLGLDVIGIGTPRFYLGLGVFPPGPPTDWTLRCTLNGANVSARLDGTQSVDADEGAARVASLRLLPLPGALDVLDYVGVPVALDFVRRIGAAEVPMRVFTGRVDTPVYDIATRSLTLSCTDDMQNRVAAMPRATLDALIGGRHTEAVQGEQIDNWDYAQARLTTVAGSMDCDALGALRVTQWDGLPLYATMVTQDLLYPAQPPSFPQRTGIINRVDIEYEYRYPRLRQRYAVLGFSAPVIDMNKQGYLYPTQQEISGAAGGSGWVQTLGVFYPAPTTIPHSTGGVVRPRAGAIDMAIIKLTQRHGQEVSENYDIVVEAPESIAQNGTLPHGLNGALEEPFDYQVWESDLSMAPLMPDGGEQDHAPVATRAASDYAIQTLLDQARVKILGSHRGATVSNATPCDPRLDLDKRLRIFTDNIDADGKVRRIRHMFDLDAGTAITEFSLAVFGAGGAGILTPDTLEPPDPPDEQVETQNWNAEIPPLFVNVYGITPYTDGLMGLILNPEQYYTVEDVPDGFGGFETISYANPFYVAGSYPTTGFRIRMPGVDDADRNPVAVPIEQHYNVVLPSDTLTITVPT